MLLGFEADQEVGDIEFQWSFCRLRRAPLIWLRQVLFSDLTLTVIVCLLAYRLHSTLQTCPSLEKITLLRMPHIKFAFGGYISRDVCVSAGRST
jgi:hypothetical protein